MRYHVLIAEDEIMTRQTILASLKRILPESFFITAENGGQAIHASDQANALDLAFLDVRMPVADGIQAAKAIRRRWKDCQIIFLTAYSDYEYMHEAIRLQAADYLLKPFSQTGLSVSVQKALNRMEQDRGQAGLSGNGGRTEGAPDWVKGQALAEFASGAAAVLKCPPRLAAPKVAGMLRGEDWKPHLDLFFKQEGNLIRMVLVSPAREDAAGELLRHVGETVKKLERLTGASPFCAVSETILSPRLLEAELEECEKRLCACSAQRPVVGNEAPGGEEPAEAEHGDKARIETYLAEHFREELSLELAAAELGCSRTYFSKRFKTLFGENFVAYLTGLRLERARALLKEGRLEIQEVARQSGFQDAAYFTSVFRRTEGETPSQYRERMGRK